MERVLEGSQAVAEAVRLAKVQIVSAFPITPQTHIVEYISEYCATGKLNEKYIRVESEHSAMAAIIGASTAGVRTFTSTSSQGLGLMLWRMNSRMFSNVDTELLNLFYAMMPKLYSSLPEPSQAHAGTWLRICV